MCSQIGWYTMKTPRTEDFDPKQSNLKSSLAGMPTIPSREERNATMRGINVLDSRPHDPITRTGEDLNGLGSERRQIKRASFEMYEDQVAKLRRIMHEDQLQGIRNDTSKMVRQAVDEFLAKRGCPATRSVPSHSVRLPHA